MAYENGNNIYNYFCEPLKYYSKDNQYLIKLLKYCFHLNHMN